MGARDGCSRRVLDMGARDVLETGAPDGCSRRAGVETGGGGWQRPGAAEACASDRVRVWPDARANGHPARQRPPSAPRSRLLADFVEELLDRVSLRYVHRMAVALAVPEGVGDLDHFRFDTVLLRSPLRREFRLLGSLSLVAILNRARERAVCIAGRLERLRVDFSRVAQPARAWPWYASLPSVRRPDAGLPNQHPPAQPVRALSGKKLASTDGFLPIFGFFLKAASAASPSSPSSDAKDSDEHTAFFFGFFFVSAAVLASAAVASAAAAFSSSSRRRVNSALLTSPTVADDSA